MLDVLSRMWLAVLICAVSVASPPAAAEPSPVSVPPSVQEPTPSSAQDAPLTLPVSLDKIKGALTGTPSVPLRGLDEKPLFKIEVREKQRIKIDDLLASLDFKGGPAVPGGRYGYEQNRLAFPAVDNPVRQPYAAFSQSELLTIVIENLAARYLGGRALNAVTTAERGRAEQAARDEVQRALAEFWAQKTVAAPTAPKE